MLGIPHPYLTSSLSGVGGRIKVSPEDFLVSEVPLYSPAGQGEHVYFEIEKVDLSTFEALERLGNALGVEPREFGYAGLKDRKGITRQTVSISGLKPEDLEALRVPQITVLRIDRHTNKLRVGHLRGNRFRVRIHDVDPSGEDRIREILEILQGTGVPNYFGPQRFGNRGDAHLVGRALLLRDHRNAVERILGRPASTEHNPNVVQARDAFMRGDLEAALASFPPTYREERRLLQYLLRAGPNYDGASKRLRDVNRRLFFTAYQSYLFNVTLSRRLEIAEGNLGAFFEGDVAFLHRNGALFRVTDLEDARARALTFEISPSGPIFGMKTLAAGGRQGDVDQAVLEAEELRIADFHRLVPKLQLEGGRRPFRVPIEDLRWSLEGTELSLEFFLPKGSYATTLLRELMKNERVPEAFYEGCEEEKHRLWRPPAAVAATPEPEGDVLPEEETET